MSSGQVPTRRTTTTAIMGSSEFELGLDDARKGVPFDWRIDEWNCERGRLFAYIAPVSMPLRIGRRLNEGAIALYRAARARNLII
jgi:hypothetical protein